MWVRGDGDPSATFGDEDKSLGRDSADTPAT